MVKYEKNLGLLVFHVVTSSKDFKISNCSLVQISFSVQISFLVQLLCLSTARMAFLTNIQNISDTHSGQSL